VVNKATVALGLTVAIWPLETLPDFPVAYRPVIAEQILFLITMKSVTMTFTDTSNARVSLVTPQSPHREAAEQLEKAVKRHFFTTLAMHGKPRVRYLHARGCVNAFCFTQAIHQ
jgi:hypothetical protein